MKYEDFVLLVLLLSCLLPRALSALNFPQFAVSLMASKGIIPPYNFIADGLGCRNEFDEIW
jgi:hypothetical protein